MCTFAPGEMAEWSIAAVLKTVDPQGSGGSNPSLSANKKPTGRWFFCFRGDRKPVFVFPEKQKKQVRSAGLFVGHHPTADHERSEKSLSPCGSQG